MPRENFEYSYYFLNQYVKIPKRVSDIVYTIYPAEPEDVRHCINLIIVNLIANAEIAYSRNKNFYTENRTKLFTWTNLLKAVDLAEEKGYAVKLKIGYRKRGFKTGLASTLGRGPRLKTIGPPVGMELDLKSLPLITIDKKPIYDVEELNLANSRLSDTSSEITAIKHRLHSKFDESLKLNRDYWNKIRVGCMNPEVSDRCWDRVGLTREFKKGGMGRWFQRGELSYQQLSKEERPRLLVNGGKVAELDYSAMPGKGNNAQMISTKG
jgi:hypothetical protein